MSGKHIRNCTSKKGQHSQFGSVALKAPEELLYYREILYTIFP